MQELEQSQFGDYLLHERIGAGGMAEIFLATAQGIEGFEKRLVIKRILPNLSDDEQFVRMFIEEAKLCVTLRHPNIVQVYDLGEIDSQYFIAMEYVDGRDLLKTLAACGKKKIGFPTDIALYIVMEVLKGLDYAHHVRRPDGQPLGIIHRDVSPSNVLLSFEGEVKIGDFGIAKASTREKTATGILKGKFGYMAPEQVIGTPIDHRADIFASGIVLYELLTGHRLFAGKNDLAVLERVRDAAIEPHPRYYRQDLDPELERIVMRALSKDREDRFQNAIELHDAIHEYVFRSRAQVTPGHLGRFMQALFLQETEELIRRRRVKLPDPKIPSLSQRAPEPLAPSFGDESTREERGAEAAILNEDTNEILGDFDEQTPLLELGGPPKRRHSSLSGEAIIAAEEDWNGLERESVDRSATAPFEESAHTDVSRSIRSAAVVDSADAIDVGSGAIVDSRPASLSGWIEPNAQAKQEVLALRKAKTENDPTDFDLEKKKERGSTRSGRRPSDEMGREPSIKKIRNGSLGEAGTDPPSEGDADFSPADIIERTGSVDDGPDEVMPTVRFESSDSAEALRGNNRAGGYEAKGRSGSSTNGTIEVPDSDMPTAEVDDVELLDEVGPTGGPRSIPPPSSSGILVAAVPGSMPDTPIDQTGPTNSGEPLAEEETASSTKARAPVPSNEESATHRFERRLSAIPSPARAESHSRRRPIPGRRERPVLLPADDDQNGLRPNRRATLGPRTTPRRRYTTRSSLDVVNPKDTTTPVVDSPPPVAPVPKEPLPERRDSSGVTAALSEAKEVDDAIAEMRFSGVHVRLDTAPGKLAEESGDHQKPGAMFDADEPTVDGTDIAQAVKRRESRRRMVTHSVVLYGEGGEHRKQKGFEEEASAPLITNAHALDAEGASELFGALDNLDDSRDAFGPDEEVSVETESRPYAQLSESLSRVEAVTIGSDNGNLPTDLGEGEEITQGELPEDEEEHGITHLGALAESTRRAASPVQTDIDLGFGGDEEETTATIDEPSSPLSRTGRETRPEMEPRVVTPRPEGSGIMIDHDFLASGGGSEVSARPDSLTSPSHSDAFAGPRSNRRNAPIEERSSSFIEQEETTQQQEESSLPEITSNNAAEHPGGDLISESFDLGLDAQEELRAPPRRKERERGEDRPPVRPVSFVPDGSQSEPQYARPPVALKPMADRAGAAGALRAVVERNRPAKELNRAKQAPSPPPTQNRMPLTPPMGVPAAAVGTPALAFPISATPSLGSADPRRAAPSFGEASPAVWVETRRTSYWTWAMYILVMFAVMLAVAAAWVSMTPDPSRTAIRPINQQPKVPKVPPKEPVKAPPQQIAKEAPPPPVEKAPEPPPPTDAVAPPREEPPAEAPDKKRVVAPKPKRPPPASGSMIAIKCREPSDIRVDGVMFPKQTAFKERFKPGPHQVRISKEGKPLNLQIVLVAGQTLTIPCD